MTTIEDLPFPVLQKILYYDWTLNSVYWAAEVWPKIDCMFRQRSNLEFKTEVDYLKVKQCKGRQKYLWIDESRDKVAYLLYGAIYQSFIADKIISVKSYIMLAEKFINLEELDVGWQNLEIFQKVGTCSNFPKLTQLHLGEPHRRETEIKDYSDEEILNNLTGLIAFIGRENFSKLELLCITLIFDETRQNCFVDSLLTFLSRHEKTLRGLEIAMARNPFHINGNGIQDWLTVPNFEGRLKNLSLSLEYIDVYFYPYYESEKFLQLVDHISLTQNSLKEHLVQYPRFSTFYTDLLEDNWKTLVTVNINMWIFYTLDCKVFEQCSVLEYLILHARPKKLVEFETENYRGESASSELVNIELLPKSLIYIKVVNFFIETKDAAKFTTEFPKLNLLSLQGIGEKENLGFTVPMFSLLLHRGVVVGVYRGFNKQSIEELQGSEDGAVTFGRLFSSEESNMLSLSGSTSQRNGLELAECYRGTYACGGEYNRDQSDAAVFKDGPSNFKVYQGQED